MTKSSASLNREADRIRFFSAHYDIQTLIDKIPNRPPQSPEDELNLIYRDGLIDLLIGLEPVVENLAKRAAGGIERVSSRRAA